MTLRRLITLPLAMLIIAGLAFAPLATPASARALGMMAGGLMGGMHAMPHGAAALDQAAMLDMASMHDMDAMSDMDAMNAMGAMHDMNTMSGMEPMAADMPCCPSDKKNDTCPDCPLMAVCALKTAQAHPSMDGALLLRTPIRTIQSAHDDALLSGLDHPPPDHPPRHLI
ncbi:hypothetical protein V1291_004559 [Nitrobacteraceae bacterium AZCC 1564]